MRSDVFAAFMHHVNVKLFFCFCLVFASLSDSVTVEDEKMLRLRHKDDFKFQDRRPTCSRGMWKSPNVRVNVEHLLTKRPKGI